MTIAIILAGGKGARIGTDIPKQYIEVNRKPMISYCLETFNFCERVDAVQIVADPKWQDYVKHSMESCGLEGKWKGFSNPGENRQLSIYHALKDIFLYASPDDLIIIHDAARPLVSAKFIGRCLACARGHDGVLPVLPMKDTVYVSEDGNRISSLLKREMVFAGQAPEVFQLGKYYSANRALFPYKILEIHGSSEPAILAGMDIVLIPGDESNYKITTAEDLERWKQWLAQHRL